MGRGEGGGTRNGLEGEQEKSERMDVGLRGKGKEEERRGLKQERTKVSLAETRLKGGGSGRRFRG